MKKLSEYQAIIVDLDGTLYYQQPVRLAMLIEMLLHFWRFPEFLIVQKYRELYEQGLSEQDRMCRLPNNAPRIIHEWMIERPLKYVQKHRDQQLIDLLQAAEKAGIIVIVYSDYPVLEKLVALDYNPNKALSAIDTGCLKPDISGLTSILESLGIIPQSCLVIGDRREKDGVLSERLGADYIILPKENRNKLYQSIQI